MSRPTVHDLHRSKGHRKWLQLHVDDAAEAEAAVEAGIIILSCEPDHHLEAIRAAAPTAFLSVGMPHGAVSSPAEAVRLGFEMLRRGADAVYCSHSPRFVEAMADEAIPVTGHVGLVPNRAAWTNFRAIGRDRTRRSGCCGASSDWSRRERRASRSRWSRSNSPTTSPGRRT